MYLCISGSSLIHLSLLIIFKLVSLVSKGLYWFKYSTHVLAYKQMAQQFDTNLTWCIVSKWSQHKSHHWFGVRIQYPLKVVLYLKLYSWYTPHFLSSVNSCESLVSLLYSLYYSLIYIETNYQALTTKHIETGYCNTFDLCVPVPYWMKPLLNVASVFQKNEVKKKNSHEIFLIK